MVRKHKNLVSEELFAREGISDENEEYENEAGTYDSNGEPVTLKPYKIADFILAEQLSKNVKSLGGTSNFL